MCSRCVSLTLFFFNVVLVVGVSSTVFKPWSTEEFQISTKSTHFNNAHSLARETFIM